MFNREGERWRKDGGEVYWGRWNCIMFYLEKKAGGWVWRVESGSKIKRVYQVSGFPTCEKAHKDLMGFVERMRWLLPLELLDVPEELKED